MERQLNQPTSSAQMPRELPRLYLIFNVPEAALGPDDMSRFCDRFARVLSGGARLVQLRAKSLQPADLLRLAGALVPLAHEAGAKVLINTSAETCQKTRADGVHRPARGLPVAELKRAAQPDTPAAIRVGVSTHSPGAALEAQAQGADFVTFSPIFQTPSKPGYGPAVGVEGLRRVCDALDIPVYALAGITPERVAPCLDAGAFGVAVMGGIIHANAPDKAVGRYLEALASHQFNHS